MGPLELADFIGLDVCLGIMRVLEDGFGQPQFAPPRVLVELVEAGHLGQKTGPRVLHLPALAHGSPGRGRVPDELAHRWPRRPARSNGLARIVTPVAP